MSRRGNDIVKRRETIWYENFTTLAGERRRKSLDTEDYAEARAEAGRRLERFNLIARGLVKAEDCAAEMTLKQAQDYYKAQHGNKKASRKERAQRYCFLFEDKLKPGTPLTAISNASLREYVSWREGHDRMLRGRRQPISPRTIQLELTHLRAVFCLVEEDLGAAVPKIRWHTKHGKEGVMPSLPARRNRPVIETMSAEVALTQFMSDDFRAVFDFCARTSKRRNEACPIRWADVNKRRGILAVYLEKKKPGAETLQEIPLAAVDDIIARVRGQHPEFVFSYLCRDTRTETSKDGRSFHRVKGERYPWTETVFKKRWEEARDAAIAAGVIGWMSFHRATRGTAITRAWFEDDPAVAQEMAAHADIRTTREYVGGAAVDAGRAMNRARAAREEAEAAAADKVVGIDEAKVA